MPESRRTLRPVSGQETNPSLLVRVRDARDDASWREFQAQYGSLVIGYARACGMQPADADDICQLVFIKLARALQGFDYEPARGRFRAYLRRVVRNEMNRLLSRSQRSAGTVSLHAGTESIVFDSAQDDADPIWDQEWVRHHYRRAWRSVRAQCDPRSLDVFDQLLSGVSVNGVAAAMEMTPASVRKIKQRMRDRLQREIAAQVDDEENHPCPPPTTS